MQKQFFTGIFFWLFIAIGFAQADLIFEQGNQAYRDGDFQEAVKKYESLLNQNKESAELYYNLGNSYYKLERLGPSIFYYEKALKLDPKNSNIKNNLALANMDKIDAIQAIPTGGVKRFWNSIAQVLHSNTWAVLAWLSIATAVVFFLLYYFTKASNLKRKWFLGSLSLFIASLFMLSFSLTDSNLRKQPFAIIWAEQVQVKDAPSSQSTGIYYLHEGTKVKITYEEENWVKILLSDGNDGWIQQHELKRL